MSAGLSTGKSVALSITIFVVLFAVQATLLAPWVERERTDARLDAAPVPGLEVPADIRLLETALGSFRGWLINILWLRAGQLQEEDRVHEAMQLARWITRLQPHYPQVWSFQSTTLAFDISITTRDPAERYLWIESGIELLRDEGILLNRESRLLYRQLAYIYWFKLGDESRDEAREYYWRRFAAEWDQLLGVPQGEGAEERARWLAPVGEAPRDWSSLLALHPELAADRDRIEQVFGGDLRAFLAGVSRGERGEEPWSTWVDDARLGTSRASLIAFVRGKVLREHYHMDPQLMVELTRELGPIDWRHPAAHAVYWGAQGELRIETQQAFPRLDDTLTPLLYRSHTVTLGLQQLVSRGRLTGDPVRFELHHAPEFLFITAYERTIFEGDPETATEVTASFETPYWRILEASLQSAWLRGEEAVATRCLDRLRRYFDETSATPGEWLIAQLEDELPDDVEAREAELNNRVAGQFFAMVREGWGDENEIIAERRRELAERLWTRASIAGASLEPMADLEDEAIDVFLTAELFEASAQAKSVVWKRLSAERRGRVPRAILEKLRFDASKAGLDPEAAFPSGVLTPRN